MHSLYDEIHLNLTFSITLLLHVASYNTTKHVFIIHHDRVLNNTTVQ